LSPEGYEGGLLIDEMTIQQDIQFSKKGVWCKKSFEPFRAIRNNLLKNCRKVFMIILGENYFIFRTHLVSTRICFIGC
jgi:hypothetical protein